MLLKKRLQEETQKLKTEYSRGELQRTTLLETCRSESEEELEKQAEINEKVLKEKETEFMQADKEQQVFFAPMMRRICFMALFSVWKRRKRH